MIKSRVAIGSQIARSRVVNSLRESVGERRSDDRQGYSPFSIERALSALTRRKDFDEKNQGRMLVRLRWDVCFTLIFGTLMVMGNTYLLWKEETCVLLCMCGNVVTLSVGREVIHYYYYYWVLTDVHLWGTKYIRKYKLIIGETSYFKKQYITLFLSLILAIIGFKDCILLQMNYNVSMSIRNKLLLLSKFTETCIWVMI